MCSFGDTCVFVWMCMRVCISMRVVNTYVCVFVWMRTCVCGCVRVCVRERVCVCFYLN